MDEPYFRKIREEFAKETGNPLFLDPAKWKTKTLTANLPITKKRTWSFESREK